MFTCHNTHTFALRKETLRPFSICNFFSDTINFRLNIKKRMF